MGLCDGTARNHSPAGSVIQVVVNTAPFGEAGLIQAARAGDEMAFDALVGPLIEPAFKLAVVFLRDPTEAEDAVRDACVKAWRKLHQLRPDAPIRPWFLSIVANQSRSLRRTRWWSVIRTDSVPESRQALDERTDANLDLDRELARLPASDRAALFLSFYLDLPLSEVGRILKISPQAAKSRVHRAVVKLRLNMVGVAS
jgi:RNA polymerase sigma factor (sigma-70 family)